MNCPKCKIALVYAHNWAYCPGCNRNFDRYDLEALQQIQDALEILQERKDLHDLIDLEAV